MSEATKKWVYRGLALLFLFAAGLFAINWMQGNTNAIGSILFNLVIAAAFLYLGFRPDTSGKNKK